VRRVIATRRGAPVCLAGCFSSAACPRVSFWGIAIVAGTLAAGIVVPLLRWHALFEAIGAGVVIVIGSRLFVDVVLWLCRVR
jgi:hypothetical protein